MKDQTRNFNAHREARLAMIVWGAEYSKQYGGSMDFWDRLSKARKEMCRRWCTELASTEREH